MPAPSVLGIDFGSCHTVAMLRRADGRVEPLLFDGSPLLSSAVFAGADGRILVGRDAEYAARSAPQCFEPNPKRRIDDDTVLLGERELTVVELFAAVLDRVRHECLAVAGAAPEAAVVTHPAGWGPRRRLALSQACAKAGLEPVTLVSEPVAAATYLTEQLHHAMDEASAVVVHDFGGGTFDAAVVSRSATGFGVLSVDGLDDVGGVDVDAAIVSHLKRSVGDDETWRQLLNPVSPEQRRAWRTFNNDVRIAKEHLSRHATVDLYIPLVDRDVHLTRTELDDLARPLVDRAIDVVRAVIIDAGLPGTPEVFLVGGASRMPLVATLLHQQLQRPPIITEQLEQIVAHGALLTGPRAAAPAPKPTTPQPTAAPRSIPKSSPSVRPKPAPAQAEAAPPTAKRIGLLIGAIVMLLIGVFPSFGVPAVDVTSPSALTTHFLVQAFVFVPLTFFGFDQLIAALQPRYPKQQRRKTTVFMVVMIAVLGVMVVIN